MPDLMLPDRPVRDRLALTGSLEPGECRVCAELEGPGCVRHLWFTLQRSGTWGRTTILRITFDDAPVPHVEAPVGDFCGCMHGQPFCPINTPWFSVQGWSGYNCFLAMPFAQSARIELENRAEQPTPFYCMCDWHRYPGQELTERRRFCARWRREMPTRRYGGQYFMLDADGPGELLGFAYGVRLLDNTDRWSHGGSENIYLDAEGDEPAYIRGIGGEDTFGTSYGGAVHNPESHLHAGMPLYYHEDDGSARPAQRLIGYRFFDADPMPFEHSIHMRFGCMANDICSTVYWYSEAPVRPFARLPDATRLLPNTPFSLEAGAPAWPSDGAWWLCGPFDNRANQAMGATLPSEERFDAAQTYDGLHREGSPWLTPASAQLGRDKARWVPYQAMRGFVDFNHVFQPATYGVGVFGEGAALARCTLVAPRDMTAHCRIAWDDELLIRVDHDASIPLGRHNAFRAETVSVPLREGPNTLTLKLSNTRGTNHGGWAFCFRATTPEGGTLTPQEARQTSSRRNAPCSE